jgi:hypothetical protein
MVAKVNEKALYTNEYCPGLKSSMAALLLRDDPLSGSEVAMNAWPAGTSYTKDHVAVGPGNSHIQQVYEFAQTG